MPTKVEPIEIVPIKSLSKEKLNKEESRNGSKNSKGSKFSKQKKNILIGLGIAVLVAGIIILILFATGKMFIF